MQFLMRDFCNCPCNVAKSEKPNAADETTSGANCEKFATVIGAVTTWTILLKNEPSLASIKSAMRMPLLSCALVRCNGWPRE